MKKQRTKAQRGAGLKYGVFGAVALLLAVMVGFKLIPQNHADLVAEDSAEEPSRAEPLEAIKQTGTPAPPEADKSLKRSKSTSQVDRGKAPGSFFLTGPADGEPMAIAKNYLKARKADLGLKDGEIDEVIITDQYASKHNGVTHIYLRQQYRGIEVINANININVAKDGSIINMGNSFVPSLADAIPTTDPTLTQVKAVQTAFTHLNLEPDQPLSVVDMIGGPSQKAVVSASGGSQQDIPVQLEYFAEPDGEVALVWALDIYTTDSRHYWEIKVDALTGDLVQKADQVVNEKYVVYPEPQSNPADEFRHIITDPYTNSPSLASPFGWHDTNGIPGAEFTITRGNNVHAYEDSSDTGASLGNEPDGGASLIFAPTLNTNLEPSTYTDASVVNLFYWNNLLHDIHYEYGFDEASGNFQVNTYGNGGMGGDAVHAEGQDGGGFNNANMLTLEDGINPRMQMYLGNKATPLRDGSFDNEVIAHEYGHGISKRLTGGPSTTDVLFWNQSGGMGEGWSDFWALALTAKAADSNTQARPMGTWLFGQAPDGPGIRPYPYSTDMEINPHTYADVASARVPHGVGSIWCAALWEMYWNLVEAHGFDVDLYNGTGGNNIALQLVMDGLKLQSAAPTLLDARDAILLADQVNNAGANFLLIWQAFAKRGMGLSADDGGSQSSLDVTEAFDIPDDLQIHPTTGFSLAGPEGGPFMPTSMLFQVSSLGTNSMPWTVTKSADWVDLSISGGTVTTNGSSDVTVTLNAGVNGLPRGVHYNAIVFSNTLNGVTQSRIIEAEVGAEFFFSESMDTYPGWTDSESWRYGRPLGLLGDPSSGFTGKNVYGNNLAGLYAEETGPKNLTTTAIDCSGYSNIEFTFKRWLGVLLLDSATVEVSNDGLDWSTYFTHDRSTVIDDGEWKEVSYDISAVADGESTVYLRWVMGVTDNPSAASYGWNIDDVSLKGIPLLPLPVRHLSWDPIAPVQNGGGAIPVTLTARDTNEELVSEFSGSVALSGMFESFGDDFEDGDYTGWVIGSGSYTREVTNATAAVGARSLTLTGGNSQDDDGLSYTLPDSTPERVEFHVRSANAEASDAFFVVKDSGLSPVASFYASDGGQMGLQEGSTFHAVPYFANRWYKITWILDWGAQTLDYYRDDTLVANNVPFASSASSLSRLELYNFDDSQAWWDDIQLADSLPLTISPSTNVTVAKGIWAGSVTVHQEASNAFLFADDGNGHIGTSRVFDVVDAGTIGARNNVLYFASSVFNRGGVALDNLGFDTTTVSSYSSFQNMLTQNTLNAGPWKLVVMDIHFDTIPFYIANDVAAYIAGGGRMLFHYRDMDGSEDGSTAAVLRSAFGVDFVTDLTFPLNVFRWDTGHPIFNTPHGVGTLMPDGNNFSFDHGDRAQRALGATALGGFVASMTGGQGAIISANNGRTLYNAFSADEMGNVVALLENEIVFLTGEDPARVLLISDSNELIGVAPFLAADGHTVTSVSNEFANSSTHLTDLGYLQKFEMVIWGAGGSGSGNLHQPAVHSTLENYVQAGGNLLVTGHDALASPVDTNMANLVRSTTTADIGASSFTTVSLDHFILNGPAGDLRNTAIIPGYTNWDGASADTAAGAISLATVDAQPFDAIIYTDIPGGGSVGYWTGGDQGASPSDGKTDWKLSGDSLDLLRNWVFGIVGEKTDVAIAMSGSPDPTFLWQPVTYSLVVVNNGPNAATGVLVTDTLPGGVLVESILSSQGTYSNSEGVISFDLGTLPVGGSAAITIEVVPLSYNVLTNQVSVVQNQSDSNGYNNDALTVSTVIPGIDGDFDGIMDWWERQYQPFLESMDETTDLDGDGAGDLAEWTALSDAEDPFSSFAIDLERDAAGQSTLYWDTAPGRYYDIYWLADLLGTFQTLEVDLPYPQNRYTNTMHTAEGKGFYKMAVHFEREEDLVVGYYDIANGIGIFDQEASIFAAGHRPRNIKFSDAIMPAAVELSFVEILYVQNSLSTSYGAEYLLQLTNIQYAVSNGMSLIIHDRAGAALGSTPILPGGESIPLVYEPSGDINVVNNSPHITNGVGGTLNDTTLDSATHSALGYALESSLPVGAIPILSQTDPTHICTFAYPYGDGWVIYSTILLDFYLSGGGTVPAFADTYAPTIVDYGAFLAH